MLLTWDPLDLMDLLDSTIWVGPSRWNISNNLLYVSVTPWDIKDAWWCSSILPSAVWYPLDEFLVLLSFTSLGSTVNNSLCQCSSILPFCLTSTRWISCSSSFLSFTGIYNKHPHPHPHPLSPHACDPAHSTQPLFYRTCFSHISPIHLINGGYISWI